ncbi:hypothetical protein N8K70_15460 [Microbacterium betulae]|uniref:Uncharacterized protein n=1 Tax=Microbacterium betulae TaxID=2981139 RepID=A0AA97I6M4_9MICO|nr:hypothetical protein [Microbacterium sp. AB]WOF22772.1 hypothetical protein N8K70_15460 [Microbacterium sp. AB]
MTRLLADADAARWVPVTGRGLRGGRHRKAAIHMLLGSAGLVQGAPGSGLLAWIANRAARAMMRHSDGRILAWVWKDDPELVVVIAQAQALTSELRAARASMPMEYDDTESFPSPFLGVGEKLVVDLPQGERSLLTASYTWDTGSQLVSLQAASPDRERFGTLLPAVDDLARSLRLSDDLEVGESNVLRLPPA